MFKVGITGGIGSGKSTVCRLFAARGVAVYDCDSEAKRLMHEDLELRRRLVERFGAACYDASGVLDRPRLAALVFNDVAALADLNALVHPAVRRDFARWAEAQSGDYVVMESAILFDAGFGGEVDRTVAVLAPMELRLQRTCRRDRADEAAVRRRMAAQLDDDTLRDRATYAIVNIFETDLEPAVAELDRRFRYEATHR